MKNSIEYKGYVGTVEFSEEDTVFFGKAMGIKALISYEGTDAHELIRDFHRAVDDYLRLCRDEGITPEKPDSSKYKISMHWSEADNCYVTVVPELPGCMSDGRTLQEAVKNTQEVIKMWIDSAKEDGERIPLPDQSLSI